MMIGLIAIGAVAVSVLTSRNDESVDSQTGAASFTQVKSSCDAWMMSPKAGDQVDDQWCDNMFAYMDDQSGGMMMGSGMWQNSERMGGTCRAWVSDGEAPAGAGGMRSCEDMVEWMSQHMSDSDGMWMMQGR
jgi:hypothetical protein